METKIEIDRDRVTAAFKALRKLGLVARQNFKCCGNCAGCQIAIDVQAMPAAKRSKLQGAVYYHQQDRARMDDGGKLLLNYGQVHTESKDVGLPTEKVGSLVVAALRDAGLLTEWDGNPSSRIAVVGTVR